MHLYALAGRQSSVNARLAEENPSNMTLFPENHKILFKFVF
jgi:hypothetical protein